jgi:hypothetical protein
MGSIRDANRQFYLNILKEQTGLNLRIHGVDGGYVLENVDTGEHLSRYNLTGIQMYELVFGATRIISEMKKSKEVTA